MNTNSCNGLLFLFRLVVVALALGAALFSGVLLWLGVIPKRGVPFFGDFMTYAAIGVGLLCILINAVLPTISRSFVRTGDKSEFTLLGLRTVGGALVFAFAAFFAGVALMLEQSWGAMIMVIVMIVGVVSRFPLRPPSVS